MKRLFLFILPCILIACTANELATPTTWLVETTATEDASTIIPSPDAVTTDEINTTAALISCPYTAPETQTANGKIRIAYTHNRNLYIWNEDGGSKQLTSSGDIANIYLSPDGEVIAYFRDVPDQRDDLWATDADGLNPHIVVTRSEFDLLTGNSSLDGTPESSQHNAWLNGAQVQWIPDTHTLAVLSSAWNNPKKFWLFDMDTGEYSPFPITGDGQFSFSPDGEYVVIHNDDGVKLYNQNGLFLYDVSIPEYDPWNWVGYFVKWAADSQYFLFINSNDRDGQERDTQFTVWRVWTSSNRVEKLAVFDGLIYRLSFSSDLEYLAYAKRVGDSSDEELHVARIDGTQNFIYSPVLHGSISNWVPGSYQFIYTYQNDVYLGDICGGKQLLPGYPQFTDSIFTGWWADSTRYYYLYPKEKFFVPEVSSFYFGSISSEVPVPGPVGPITEYSVTVIQKH